MDNTEEFRCISLCSGYAGIELGLRRAVPNLRTVAYVEVEAFACANLVAKIEAGLLDAAPVWTDIKTFDGRPFRGRVDIVTGGYPCQPFSIAGKRKGTDDPRHLWPHIERLVQTVRPVWCFFENVAGYLAIGYPEVYRSLRLMGYRVEAGLFTAAECGASHRRERLFILANSPDFGHINSRGMQDKGGEKRNKPPVPIGGRGGGFRWPARPGQSQCEWEEPRTMADSENDTSTANKRGIRQPIARDDTRLQGETETKAQPRLGGAAYGASCRVDRLRLLGNGVVPQCVEKAFRTLMEKFEK